MLRYIFLGIIFIFAGEFLVNFVFKETLAGFFGTLMLYTLLLIAGFGIIFLLKKWIRSMRWLMLSIVILFGTLGLFVMEWIVIGNTPSGNPDANQLAMFIWWAGVFIMPLLWQETSSALLSLRNQSMMYHFGYSVSICMLIFLAQFIPTMKFIALFVFIYGLFPYAYFIGSYVLKKKGIEGL